MTPARDKGPRKSINPYLDFSTTGSASKPIRESKTTANSPKVMKEKVKVTAPVTPVRSVLSEEDMREYQTLEQDFNDIIEINRLERLSLTK